MMGPLNGGLKTYTSHQPNQQQQTIAFFETRQTMMARPQQTVIPVAGERRPPYATDEETPKNVKLENIGVSLGTMGKSGGVWLSNKALAPLGNQQLVDPLENKGKGHYFLPFLYFALSNLKIEFSSFSQEYCYVRLLCSATTYLAK
jgi:hypothetical protein